MGMEACPAPDQPTTTQPFFGGRVAELLAGLGHQFLETLAGLGPGLVAQRDFAAALAFALVFAGVFAAAALALAVVHAVAVVGGHGRAMGLAGALVGRSLFAFVLASVDAPADVRVLEQPGRRVGLLVLGVLLRAVVPCPRPPGASSVLPPPQPTRAPRSIRPGRQVPGGAGRAD